MEKKLEGVDSNYSWSFGTDVFRVGYATPIKWVKLCPWWSWVLFLTYSKHRDGKVLHLSLLGLNIAYQFKK